jgi:hypothetical protein
MSPPNEPESSSLAAAARSRIKRAGKKAAAAAAAKPRALRRKALSPPVTDPVDQTSVGQAQTQVPVPEPVLEHEEVARLAYSYWESRDHQGGSPEEDWYRAVEELRRRKSPPAIASSY